MPKAPVIESPQMPYCQRILAPHKRRDGHPSQQVITISCATGVGGTTAHKMLMEEFPGWKFASAGSIARKYAAEKGMTIEDFAAHSKDHPEEDWDRRIDSEIVEIGKGGKAILEGRLPHIFLPLGFNVLLVCDVEVRADRRWRDTHSSLSFSEVEAQIIARDRDDATRYNLHYPGWAWAGEEFDLTIDTGKTPPDGVINQILGRIPRGWRRKRSCPVVKTA